MRWVGECRADETGLWTEEGRKEGRKGNLVGKGVRWWGREGKGIDVSLVWSGVDGRRESVNENYCIIGR